MRPTTLLLFATLGVHAAGAFGARDLSQVAPFFGEYQGEAVSDTGGEVRKRDLHVNIERRGEGFAVKWVSVSRRANGEIRRKEQEIEFLPAGREDIFRSAMRKDLFGNRIPLDPINGDPYVWARLEGEALVVYMLLVLEDGGYELHTYRRTLIPEGLHLEFSRIRDGEIFRTVTGTLRRVK
ncbi:MAG: hypothetical protein R3286_06130 [Gammaproteobacteria bacterium]|nr:hypothetical protein [Gammaproteobacteria bacterium]